MKRYTDNPLQVRIYEHQDIALNKMMRDTQYLKSKGIYSKSDAVRTALFRLLKEYESENNIRSITS